VARAACDAAVSSDPAHCLLRKPLRPAGGIVQQLCRRVRQSFGQPPERDMRNTTNCDVRCGSDSVCARVSLV